MKRIGILGFGAIGQKIYSQILEEGLYEVGFIYEAFENDRLPKKISISKFPSKEILSSVDLVVEATYFETVLSYGCDILEVTNLLVMSTTAFANERIDKVIETAKKNNKTIYVPHGAILGLDGIFDGQKLINSVEIITTKNPKSLGREDTQKTILFEGSTRELAKLKPRNVNVHAAIAIAGIGFDKTVSKLISDPSIIENTHTITVKGADFEFQLSIKSNPIGKVTGAYTPISAYGSIKRILKDENETIQIV